MHDPWNSWQAFMTAAGRQPSDGPAAFGAAAERFGAAAARFFSESGAAAARADAAAVAAAARTFSRFLRDETAALLKNQFGAAWVDAMATGAADAGPARQPALGLSREHQLRWQRASDAWRRMVDAQQRLTIICWDCLNEAADAFAVRAGRGAAPAGDAPAALKSLYDAWIDCAETAYAEAAHGDAFCAALADYINAHGEWRGEMMNAAQAAAKALDQPSRDELDSLHERLRALELKLEAQRPQATSSTQSAHGRPASGRPASGRPASGRPAPPRRPTAKRRSKP